MPDNKTNNNIRISAADIRKVNNFPLPDKVRDIFTNGFWYYTSADTAEKILNSSSFHVSCFNQMNDLNEIILHKDKREIVHALCFVNSDSEKIPMWYLYGGIEGKGISLGLTPSTMLKFIKGIKKVTPVDSNAELVIGKDIELQYGWIYYRKQEQGDKNYSQVFFKGNWYTVINKAEFEQNNYFIKDYDWNYEKEFRLVFINLTNTSYQKLKVVFDDSVLRTLKIRTAPEMDENTKQTFLESYGARKWLATMLSSSKIGIKMDLLKRNKESIISYITGKSDTISEEELRKVFPE